MEDGWVPSSTCRDLDAIYSSCPRVQCRMVFAEDEYDLAVPVAANGGQGRFSGDTETESDIESLTVSQAFFHDNILKASLTWKLKSGMFFLKELSSLTCPSARGRVRSAAHLSTVLRSRGELGSDDRDVYTSSFLRSS